MSAKIIHGKALAKKMLHGLALKVKQLYEEQGACPCIAIIQVGENPASNLYITNKIHSCKLVGIRHKHIKLDNLIEESLLVSIINELNQDNLVSGIIVQLPLPKHIDKDSVIFAIKPEKDIDGFHPTNQGKLLTNKEAFIPCTPLGCMTLLRTIFDDFSGKKATIIGRSSIVGRPMALLLLRANCTVTVTHSYTVDTKKHCQDADIIIAAVGKKHLVKKDWVKKGAVIIDVGINIDNQGDKKQIYGDVDFHRVKNVAGAITPVPGGVGPMTIYCLLENTVRAAFAANNLNFFNDVS